MCADQFVFRQSFIDAFCTTVVCASDWLVNLAQFTEFLQIEIHSLVGDSWQRVSSEIDVGILVEYCSGILVEFDGDGVGGLDCCDGYGIACDIGSLKKTVHLLKPTKGLRSGKENKLKNRLCSSIGKS